MAHVFISYARQDGNAARELERTLIVAGFSTFLDTHPINGIAAGTDWLDELVRAIAQTQAVIYLSSAESAASPWCQAELIHAYWSGKLILPVQLDDAEPPLRQRVQSIRISPGGDKAWTPVVELLHSQFPFSSSTRAISRTVNPYPGLRSFNEDEAELFFGRSEIADEIVRRLVAPLATPEEFMVAVTGPSGCGKSSLVTARILPLLRLRPEGVACVGPSKPGVGSSNELDSEDELLNRVLTLQGGSYSKHVVLVIDQAERLFTEYDVDVTHNLVTQLERLAMPNPWFRCLIIFRSDIIASSAVDQLLGRYLIRPVRVPVLQRTEMRLSIAEPATMAGLRFEDGLVERVLDDVGSGDALPLLAYCLWNLAEMSGRERVITLNLYRESGGVKAALRLQAEGALAELNARGISDDQVFAVLIRLASVTSNHLPTAKTIESKSLSQLDGEILDSFVARKLVIKDSLDRAESYHAAHEELLRWPVLAGYIETRRGELLVLNTLEGKAISWKLGSAGLLEGDDLAHARYFEVRGLSSDGLKLLTAASKASDRPPLWARILRPIVLFYGFLLLFAIIPYLAVLTLHPLYESRLQSESIELADNALAYLLIAVEVIIYIFFIRQRFRISRYGFFMSDGPKCSGRSYLKRWLFAPAGILLTPFDRRFNESRLTWVDKKTSTELVAIGRDGSRRNGARNPMVDLYARGTGPALPRRPNHE